MSIDMEVMLAKIKDRQWALADIDWDAPGAETITARLPNARLVELDGQQHTAMLLAPAAFAAAVNAFLS